MEFVVVTIVENLQTEEFGGSGLVETIFSINKKLKRKTKTIAGVESGLGIVNPSESLVSRTLRLRPPYA